MPFPFVWATARLPSVLHWRDVTHPPTVTRAFSAPVFTSKTRSTPLSQPSASVLPSGLGARLYVPLIPANRMTCAPVATLYAVTPGRVST